MNKLLIVFSFLVIFLLSGVANAASTIGTNMSTTGTFTQTVGSATAARFQNAAGTTTVLIVDTTNTRVGVNAGTDVDTTFEVGGTASISGVSTWADGQFRPQSNGTTAFRFQNAAGTTSVLTIDTTNARVGIGATPGTTFEVQGTASASYFLTGNTIQVGGFSSVAYSRFGTNTTTHVGTVSGANDLLVSGGLEVNGSAAFDGFALFGAGASVATNFEITGNNRFSINGGNVTNTTFEVGGTASISGIASVSGNFSAGGKNTGTSSFEFDAPSTTQGGCFRIKDVDGSGYTYLRVSNGIATFSTVDCR